MTHADAFRAHVSKLSAKAYWKQLGSPLDLVVMFVPNDSFVAAAAVADPGIIDKAMEKKVVVATPATLLALLKTVELGWSQEQMAENAGRISDAGSELRDRAVQLVGYIQTLGRELAGTVKAYNKTVGSYESRFRPGVERLEKLGAKGKKELEEPQPIEEEPRVMTEPEEETGAA